MYFHSQDFKKHTQVRRQMKFTQIEIKVIDAYQLEDNSFP